MRILMAVLLCCTLYMIPGGIAVARSHSNTSSIIVLNLLLGLSGIGWVIALIWAFSDNVKSKPNKDIKKV